MIYEEKKGNTIAKRVFSDDVEELKALANSEGAIAPKEGGSLRCINKLKPPVKFNNKEYSYCYTRSTEVINNLSIQKLKTAYA